MYNTKYRQQWKGKKTSNMIIENVYIRMKHVPLKELHEHQNKGHKYEGRYG